jgi:hypothetical protein
MTMPTDTQPASLTNALYWTGAIVTGLTVLFLLFDGVTKVVAVPQVVDASTKLGIPRDEIAAIGAVLLACVTIYVIPRTALLGAVLLTGYLGGAIAIHVRAASGAFPIVFSAVFAVLVWVGLVLREPRLFWLILLRQ